MGSIAPKVSSALVPEGLHPDSPGRAAAGFPVLSPIFPAIRAYQAWPMSGRGCHSGSLTDAEKKSINPNPDLDVFFAVPDDISSEAIKRLGEFCGRFKAVKVSPACTGLVGGKVQEGWIFRFPSGSMGGGRSAGKSASKVTGFSAKAIAEFDRLLNGEPDPEDG